MSHLFFPRVANIGNKAEHPRAARRGAGFALPTLRAEQKAGSLRPADEICLHS
jgi:hypothetical protein